MFRIWGLNIEEIIVDGRIWWKVYIKSPFYKEGWKFGLNSKLFLEAQTRGVEKFLIQIGGREIIMAVPSQKYLKEKTKKGEVEYKPSMFENSEPLKIYYFTI